MMETSIKVENVAELVRKTLKENGLCCCAGDFLCANCRLLYRMQEPRDHNCPVCMGGVA